MKASDSKNVSPSLNSNSSDFWKAKNLNQLSTQEWESLCDGCGKCCLHKLEDEDTGRVSYTAVACTLLNIKNCKCTNYKFRTVLVPDCLKLSAENLMDTNWLPSTCAYRLVAEGKDLYWWHHLISGDPNTVHLAGISVRNRAINEEDVKNVENHIVEWPNEGI